MADITPQNETLLQRLAKFLPGATKRAAIRQVIDDLADIARLQPTQGKLEALIDLRDRVKEKLDKFGLAPFSVAMIGTGLIAVALPSVLAITFMMGTHVSSFGILDAMWTVGKPVFEAMGLLAAVSGASGIVSSMTSKPGRALKGLFAHEADKIVKARPDAVTGLSPRYAQRLTELFAGAAPYPAKYDEALAEKVAIKNAAAQSYWKEKAAEQKL